MRSGFGQGPARKFCGVCVSGARDSHPSCMSMIWGVDGDLSCSVTTCSSPVLLHYLSLDLQLWYSLSDPCLGPNTPQDRYMYLLTVSYRFSLRLSVNIRGKIPLPVLES